MKNNYENVHIVPLFSALDRPYGGTREQHFSTCERPCVCHCICRHGRASALDFSKVKGLGKKIEKLFIESLAA